MQIIKGKYNEAMVFTDKIDVATYAQILDICNLKVFEGLKIRIMPDCHAGAGCVIGYTATFDWHIIPNLIGVDINCGLDAINLGPVDIDYKSLDRFIREKIPYGFNVNSKPQVKLHPYYEDGVKKIAEKTGTNLNRHFLSLGSLGSGNHFIEVNEDKSGNKWIVVHSGSRNLGKVTAEYHQKKAKELIKLEIKEEERLKGQAAEFGLFDGSRDKGTFIQSISDMMLIYHVPKDLEFLGTEMPEGKEYIEDMQIVQEFAKVNRQVMIDKIIDFLGKSNSFTVKEVIKTNHNYIDLEEGIIRKGAISAQKGEKVIIPINMREGSIIAIGKGNSEWNYSAPHGAGRVMSRSQAKKEISLVDYEETMKNVWSSTVTKETIDEAPFAYKAIEDIIDYVADTIEIVDIVKPVYNFKA